MMAVSAGGLHTCAILDDGSVKCWGASDVGQIGDGGTEYPTLMITIPTQTASLGTGRSAMIIGTSQPHVGQSTQTFCAIGTYQPATGQASCHYADAGHYVETVASISQTKCNPGTYQPAKGQSSCLNASVGHSSENNEWISISSGYKHTCAIHNNGLVSCWGLNSNGMLGDGTTSNRKIPTRTQSLGVGRTATAISAGAWHTCALLDDSVSCWGLMRTVNLGMDHTLID